MKKKDDFDTDEKHSIKCWSVFRHHSKGGGGVTRLCFSYTYLKIKIIFFKMFKPKETNISITN